MRYIEKGCSPPFFEQFKNDFVKLNNKSATYADITKKDEYYDLKFHILNEQFGLCCYCMKEIDMNDNTCHIEHFIPQSIEPRKAMDYDNLLVSCDGFYNNRENCGHKKGNWYSEFYTISPLAPDCELLFKYNINGNIMPENDNDLRAKETINNLDLDSHLLQRARKRAIFCALKEVDERKQQIINEYSNPCEGRLPAFCLAVLYVIKNI